MRLAKGLVVIVFLALTAFAFSTASGNVLQPQAESNGGEAVTHHSHPTKMSLQGKVEGVSNGNLGVKVADENSCSSGVFFDHNYASAIQGSLFNLSLGSQFDLNLNYNQDYYLCLYVNGELVDGPQEFRGGQGQIGMEDVNFTGDLNVFGDVGITDSLWADILCLTADTCYTDLDSIFQDDVGSDCPTYNYAYGVQEDGTLKCRGDSIGCTGASDEITVGDGEGGSCTISFISGCYDYSDCEGGNPETPYLYDWNGIFLRKVGANLFELKGVAMIPLEGYDAESNFTFTIHNPKPEREYFDYIILNQRCHFGKQMGYKSYSPDQTALGKNDEQYIFLDQDESGTFSFSDITIPAKCIGADFINYQLEIGGYYENV